MGTNLNKTATATTVAASETTTAAAATPDTTGSSSTPGVTQSSTSLPIPSPSVVSVAAPAGNRNKKANDEEKRTERRETEREVIAASSTSLSKSAQQQQQQVVGVVTPNYFDSKQLEEEVTKAVEKSISKLVPTINKKIQESFAVLARPLRNSMDSLSKKGVTLETKQLKAITVDLGTPLKAELVSTMKTVFIPTVESLTGQILHEVKTTLPKLIPAPLPAPKPLPPPPPPAPPPPVTVTVVDSQTPKLLAALSQQLLDMNSKMDSMTQEISVLKTTVANQAAAAAAAAAAAQQQAQAAAAVAAGVQQRQQQSTNVVDPNAQLIQVRDEVIMLLRQHKYEEAFTKAVATTSPQMAVYCCANSDIHKVLQSSNTGVGTQQGAAVVLPQAILICLMQQLSAALANATNTPQELQVEVVWLQEIALCMNPKDVSIAQHVPRIVQQLITTVQNLIQKLDDQTLNPVQNPKPQLGNQFRRPLQMLLHVLRGMMQ